MSLAPIWLSVALGWVVIIGLMLLRTRYTYKTILTDSFTVTVPQPWLNRSIYAVAFLELCRQSAQTSFSLSQTLHAEVEVRPSWWPTFWFQPESRRIVLCFLFGPAIDRWLFSIYYGIAHEYGHFILETQTPVQGEAWSNLFCLYVLYGSGLSYPWPRWWESWLIRRDAITGLATLHIWRFLPGRRHQIAARFWELWQVAQEDCKAVVSIVCRDRDTPNSA